MDKSKETKPASIKMARVPQATHTALQNLLEPHGIQIEVCDQEERPYCLLHLPEGAKQEADGFLGAQYQQNKITLPDGFQIVQRVDLEGWSTIQFPREEEQL
jgi:hypothetical protein